MRRLFKSPLVHCLLLGALLYVIDIQLQAPEPIFIAEKDWQQAQLQWARATGRMPGEQEKQTILEQLANQHILWERAQDRGMHELPIVQTRMAQLAHFLKLVPDDSSNEEAIAAAKAMNLHQSDPMVKRYMTNALREQLAWRLASEPISEQQIRQVYEAQSERFTHPERFALSHIYIADGDGAEQKARALLEQLDAQPNDPQSATSRGDVFYGGHHFAPQNRNQIARRMGPGFAESLNSEALNAWQGPIKSSYGWHLVWLSEYEAPRSMPIEAVADRIKAELQKDQREKALSEFLKEQRQGREILVEQSFSPESSTQEDAA